jgi:hypothetical protein
MLLPQERSEGADFHYGGTLTSPRKSGAREKGGFFFTAPHPAGANESARAIAQASRKRPSLVPSISSPGRSDG